MNTGILTLTVRPLVSTSFLIFLCDSIYLSSIPLRNTLIKSKTRIAIRHEIKNK